MPRLATVNLIYKTPSAQRLDSCLIKPAGPTAQPDGHVWATAVLSRTERRRTSATADACSRGGWKPEGPGDFWLGEGRQGQSSRTFSARCREGAGRPRRGPCGGPGRGAGPGLLVVMAGRTEEQKLTETQGTTGINRDFQLTWVGEDLRGDCWAGGSGETL